MTDVSGEAEGTRPTVVVVDDSHDVRSLIRTRLAMSGRFDVVDEGGDGEEAITLAYRYEPDLMMLDTSMPSMDGLEALPGVLAVSPETRVVMFTGFEERALADRAIQLGAADFIEKSIRLEELTDRLLQTLDLAGTGPSRRLRLATAGQERPAYDDEQGILDEHLEQFRELFDRAATGMATLTLDGSIVRANHALAALWACQPTDLVGEDYGRLTRGRGDVLDRALEAISTLGEDLTTFEHTLDTGTEERTLQVTLAPIRDSKGQALYVFAQIQDITAQRSAEEELRRSEENFRLLVSAVGEYAIFMLDTEGRVLNWNAGAQRIKGYAAPEIIGKHFRIFYPTEEQVTGHPEENLGHALRDGEYAEEGWRVRKDGSTFWASVVISAVYDDDGRHIGFAKVTRDQTARREYEEERQRAAEQQNHLLSVTAHELRTPTTIIDGSAGTLQHHWAELNEQDRERFLYGIRSSAHRLHRLVSDLTVASRLKGGDDTLRLRPEMISLVETLRSAVARTRLGSPTVDIDLELPRDVRFEADPGRVGQAIDNLIDNAVRHGAPPIRLTGGADDEYVHIRVSDSGDGVSEELLPRLFDQFAIGGRNGGAGLGLYLVREIARGHGGEASYHPPTADRPATFDLTVPCAQ